MMVKVVLEGLILSVLLFLICFFGIRDGAVNMVYLYEKDVQERAVELGLTTPEEIKKRACIFKVIGIMLYLSFTMISVFVVNHARGFGSSFCQFVTILLIMQVFDRIVIDVIWVGHTKAWVIPGTEDLMPYIPVKIHILKWIVPLVFYPAMSALICWIISFVVK